MGEGDVKNLVEQIRDGRIAHRTVKDYEKVIKFFWRWLNDLPEGEYPEPVDWINTTLSNTNDRLPTDLFTREDIEAIKQACRNPRDRAFIAMLYETGARKGEVIDLTVGDI